MMGAECGLLRRNKYRRRMVLLRDDHIGDAVGAVFLDPSAENADEIIARVRDYGWLVASVDLFPKFPKVAYDHASENQFQQLLALKLRIGTQDLKIAAVALANNLTLLTRNRRDFGRVPNLKLDDWSV